MPQKNHEISDKFSKIYSKDLGIILTGLPIETKFSVLVRSIKRHNNIKYVL